MLSYKWEVLSPTKSRVYRIVRDLMGNHISDTSVTFDWCYPLPPESYYEKLYLSIDKF
jgi:hypothetical protein